MKIGFDQKLVVIARQKGYKVNEQTTWEQAYNQILLNEIEPHLGRSKQADQLKTSNSNQSSDKTIKVKYNSAIIPTKNFEQYINLYIGEKGAAVIANHFATAEDALAGAMQAHESLPR